MKIGIYISVSGLFIVFEGIEGCGKSTQARLLYKRLSREGLPCILTKEPGGTSLGNKLRSLLKREPSILPEAELLLFNASRVQLVEEVIKPALKEGKIVISDRFFPSTMAYQGYGRGLDRELITTIHNIIIGEVRPDVFILLDLEEQAGLSRKSRAGDRFEKESIDFHKKVRQGYLDMARADPARWFTVDARKGKGKIAAEIYRKVKEGLKQKITDEGLPGNIEIKI